MEQASIEKFFPGVCLLPPSLRFPLPVAISISLAPSVYFSLYKQADFGLKRDTSNGEGFLLRRVQGKVAVRLDAPSKDVWSGKRE